MVDNHYRWDFIGLSTDTKPTPETSEKVTNGSTFYCSDNSKLYVWYKTQWYEKVVDGGGSSYTAGDGIDISNNEISVDTTTIQPKLTAGTNITIDADNVISAEGSTETFGYRKLTTDDYNWNKTTNTTENPDCIALWLLPSGVYYGPSYAELGGTSKVLTSRTHSAYDSNGHVWRVYHASGTGVAHIYEWYSGDSRNIKCFTTYTTPAISSGNPGSGTTADGATIQTSDILATTAGNGTTVAITQNAATSLVFADPSTRYKVRIGGTKTGTNATSVGRSASASGENSIALGSYASASTKGEMNIGTSTEATGGYNDTPYRLLTGLYDGQSAHDAVTVEQVNATIDAINTALSISIPHIGA